MADQIERLKLLTEAESGDLQSVLQAIKLLMDMAGEANQTAEKLEDLGREADEAGDEIRGLGKDVDSVEKDVGQFREKIEALDRALAVAEDGAGDLGAKLKGLRGALNEGAVKAYGGAWEAAKQSLIGFQRRLGELALEKTIEAIKAGAVAVAEFDESIAQVAGLTGATASGMEKLRDAAQEMGSTMRFSATEAAGLQAEFAKAGFSVNEILDAMGPSATLAQVGFTDLTTAAGIAATQVRAFGGEAAETSLFVDQLAKQANSAKTTATDLGIAMGKVAPSAVAMNAAMGDGAKSATDLQKEMLAMAGTLANTGIEGEEAGVAMSNLQIQLTQLQNPTKLQAELMAKLGLTADDLDPRIHGLQGAIENLAAANRSGGEMFDLVGAKAGRAGEFLVQNTEMTRQNVAALDEAGGFGLKLAKIYDDNLVGAYKSVLSAAEGFALVLGDAGPADAARTALDTLATTLRNNQEAAEALGVVFGSLGAGLNAIFTAITTGFTVGIDALVTATNALGEKIGQTMQLLSKVVGLASEDMAESWRVAGAEMERISREKMEKAWRDLQHAGRQGAESFGKIGSDFAGIFGGVEDATEKASDTFVGAMERMTAAAERSRDAADSIGGLGEAADEAAGQTDEAAQALFEMSLAALELANGVEDAMKDLAGTELEAFKAATRQAAESMIEDFRRAGQEAPPELIDALVAVAGETDKLREKVGVSFDAVHQKALDLAVGVKAALQEGFETPEALAEFKEAVRDDVEASLDNFERLGVEAPQYLQEVADAVDALPEKLRRVRELTEGLLSSDEIAKEAEAITAAFDGISEKTPQARERFRELTDGLTEDAKAAGVDVPASIARIRDELGITAEKALEAREIIEGAFGGLAESIDVSQAGAAEKIRKYFTDLIMGSEEMREAFANLDAESAMKLEGLISGLDQAASEGSLTQERLEATEKTIKDLLDTSSTSSGSVGEFNEALSQIGTSGQGAADGMNQATEAGERQKLVWDEATGTYRQAREALDEASEALKVPGAEEGAGRLRDAQSAADDAGKAASGAGKGFAEIGEAAAGAATGLDAAAEASANVAAGQGALAEQAGAAQQAMTDILAGLVSSIEQLTGVDLSGMVTQINAAADGMGRFVELAKQLPGPLAESSANAAALAANLDRVEGEGGGQGGNEGG